MKIKVKGPIVIELTDLEFDTEEIKKSFQIIPMITASVLQRGPPQEAPLYPPNLKLSKDELLAFATQMKLPDLEKMIKDLQEILKRRKEG